ncbi:2-isopropylmalate synthase [bacterium]|nr:2-isopropylmalate synthase [bacterium]
MALKKERILIFDTTLRDGEQSPGASLNIKEKLEVAEQLERLGVDIIEAGFPISSPGDFEAVKLISRKIRKPVIAGLARATKRDIDVCWDAIKYARNPRIHTFIATSDIHLKYKLRKSREEVLKEAVAAVKYARKFTHNVEFSAEDAVRTDPDFLCQVLEETIEAGTTTINIPDTVGYALPEEFGRIIRMVIERVPNSNRAIISVHCHNDLGLATANSLEAISLGARQIECTINGIGERAGNASLEEVVMALRTRKDLLPFYTNIETREIAKTSRLVSKLTGIIVQPNKAIVGANAFAHEAGIHQDGVIKERLTYEIMTPESVGLGGRRLVLGKHSGRHAFRKKLQELGYKLTSEQVDRIFQQFKLLADKTKEIFDEDIEAIVEDQISLIPEIYKLEYINVITGNTMVPTATVKLGKLPMPGKTAKSEVLQEASCGDGPVDAAFRAIDRITNIKCRLIDYSLKSVSVGKDAIGEVTVKIAPVGRARADELKKIVTGRGTSTDIIEASAKAYINALNRLVARRKRGQATFSYLHRPVGRKKR